MHRHYIHQHRDKVIGEHGRVLAKVTSGGCHGNYIDDVVWWPSAIFRDDPRGVRPLMWYLGT